MKAREIMEAAGLNPLDGTEYSHVLDPPLARCPYCRQPVHDVQGVLIEPDPAMDMELVAGKQVKLTLKVKVHACPVERRP